MLKNKSIRANSIDNIQHFYQLKQNIKIRRNYSWLRYQFLIKYGNNVPINCIKLNQRLQAKIISNFTIYILKIYHYIYIVVI